MTDLEAMYPWDVWLDGDERDFQLGVHFQCNVTLANRSARYMAYQRGGRWESEITGPESLRGRFVPGR